MVTNPRQNNHSPLDVRSLGEQIYEYLKNGIQTGQLVPGAFIKLNEISARLGVSKTPLRDALIRLECEGFVTILPRRGVVVNKLSLNEIKDILEIVGALESDVVKSVFPQITPAHIKTMRQINSEMRACMQGKKLKRFDQNYFELNISFHDIFLGLSGNNALRGLIMPYKRRLYDFPRLTYISQWELINCDEHDRFIQFIEAGQPDEAARLWRDEHWSFTAHEQYIREFYAQGSRQTESQLA
ncbi:MAG: GntR family transcriptional regulator [Desulfobacterales bacterium]|nr:GntR family transcriptional regulator [Desulfobacterales bacterium]